MTGTCSICGSIYSGDHCANCGWFITPPLDELVEWAGFLTDHQAITAYGAVEMLRAEFEISTIEACRLLQERARRNEDDWVPLHLWEWRYRP